MPGEMIWLPAKPQRRVPGLLKAIDKEWSAFRRMHRGRHPARFVAHLTDDLRRVVRVEAVG